MLVRVTEKNLDKRASQGCKPLLLGLAAGAFADGFKRQLAPPEHLAPLIRDLA
jgi:hypothetical protein